MLKRSVLTLLLTLLTTGTALAANYIDADELKPLLLEKREIIIVDIQPAAAFEQHHLPSSIETDAFPVATDAEKARLDKVLPIINASHAPVVVVCPSGKSGAKNAYLFLASKGIPEGRMQILAGGIKEWPYSDLLVKGR